MCPVCTDSTSWTYLRLLDRHGQRVVVLAYKAPEVWTNLAGRLEACGFRSGFLSLGKASALSA
jgi:hypothetical protein